MGHVCASTGVFSNRPLVKSFRGLFPTTITSPGRICFNGRFRPIPGKKNQHIIGGCIRYKQHGSGDDDASASNPKVWEQSTSAKCREKKGRRK